MHKSSGLPNTGMREHVTSQVTVGNQGEDEQKNDRGTDERENDGEGASKDDCQDAASKSE